MSIKATFNNQYLGIYVRGSDLDALLEVGSILVPVFWGKEEMPGGSVWVALDQNAMYSLKGALDAERSAIEAVRRLSPEIVAEPKKPKRKEGKSDAEERAAGSSADPADQDGGGEQPDGLQPDPGEPV